MVKLDNPILIIVVAVFVVGLLLFMRKKEQAKKDGQANQKAATVKKAKAATQKQPAASEASKHDSDDEEISEEDVAEFENSDNWVAPAPVSVSVQQVDAQTEYQVYKEFGYLDKAAEALGEYLKVLPFQPKEQVLELLSLWMEVGNIDKFTEELTFFKGTFSKEDLELLVREGLAIENNNLSLRVFADEMLGWGVEAITEEIGASEISPAAKPVMDNVVHEEEESAVGNTEDKKHYSLVRGHSALGHLDSNEIMVVESFSAPDKAARLLTGQIDYESVTRFYNKASDSMEKPETVLIDALKVDYQNKNLNNFAYHLWYLYQKLGRYGKSVKERMLGWGYTLGNHKVFSELAQAQGEQSMRQIGLAYGYIPSEEVGPERLELVERKQATLSTSGASESQNDLNSILNEAEADLMYGELDGAITTLEVGILAMKDEPQLYMMLFDLYERAEAWKRFDEFSSKLRRSGDEMPEEVLLRLSRLTQLSASKKVTS